MSQENDAGDNHKNKNYEHVDAKLRDKRIAIVNSWDNKFNYLYSNYFNQRNEVRLSKVQTNHELFRILKWADIVWTQWSNELLVEISKQSFDATLVTYIRSYEILTSKFIRAVKWNRVDGILYVADHVRRNANRLWRRELAEIPQLTVFNSVDLSKYAFNMGGQGKNIGYIGYLNHKKGVGLLLQCMKAVVDYDPEYRFHIAGEFQDTRFEVYMIHMIDQMGLSDNVAFYGWVNDISTWLIKMNYVLSTSPWEGCPNNIIEAMACGVKPLIHNWQGAGELFPTKFIFNTVSEFLSLVKENDYHSKEYRTAVEENFNDKINLPKIDQFLAQCLSNRIERLDTAVAKHHQGDSQKGDTHHITEEKSHITDDSETEHQNTGVNFFQPLSRTIQLTSNRKALTVEFCIDKRVLHVGCVDSGMMDTRIKSNTLLHHRIGNVAKHLIGVDVDVNGLQRLADEGYEVYEMNLEKDVERLRKLSKQVDIIVIPEVIEHLNNVGQALENLKACEFDGKILISTPNAFSRQAHQLIGRCVELVHPDHNYYFSPATLKTIIEKHGLEVERLVMYYWPSNDPNGMEIQKIITTCPYYAEGMIAIVKDLAFEKIEKKHA